MEKRPYHHGDLRAALIAAGLAMLHERAADDLGLRELARRVGVSATAVYRHFPDKQALMTALAHAGLAQLAAEQHAASDAAGGGEAGFDATGRAYVKFALANPALFRLIFSHAKSEDSAPDSADTPDAMRFLRENAMRFTQDPERARLFALRAWSLVHGLSVLMLDGMVPADPALADAVVDAKDFAPG